MAKYQIFGYLDIWQGAPNMANTLQPTVQILSRFLQEQILVRRKSQDLFSKSQELLKKLLATLKVSGALFAASYRNLRTSLTTLKVSGPLF